MITNPTLAIDTDPPGARARAGSVWDYVSASRLNLWAKCPLAFKLRYVDGIRTPTTASMFLGHRVHAGLEFYYRHRQLGISPVATDVTAHLTETWEEAVHENDMRFATANQEAALQAQTAKLVTAYLEQVPADEGNPLAVETAFEVPLLDPTTGRDLGVPLVGVVDLVLAAPAGPIVIDFKTAARGGDLAAIMHEIQLSCYAYGFRRSSGQQESGLQIRRLIKTKVPKIETHTVAARSEKHFRRLFALVRAYLADLRGDAFVYRPGFGCGLCEFRDSHCQRWGGN